tara:strand:- start:192 stop:392 length:201 start_codon:yes stop_codon:yes gene_type:complete
MMKKSVSINEDMNEIRYYEKDIIDNTEDYLSTVLKYLCTKSDCDEEKEVEQDYILLKNGKRIKKID